MPAQASVSAVLVQPDGKILIGGEFSSINGVDRPGLARLNNDGTLDATFGDNLAGLNGVGKFALQSDGKILIAGGFSQINNELHRNIARLNNDGTLDTRFVEWAHAIRT